jgi:hypothetical protein
MSVSRVDHAVLQLRAQLQRLARERAGRSPGSARSEPRPLERLRAAPDGENAHNGEFRRKFVRALLTEELGEAIANEPEFERISNEVWRLLDEDSDTRAMMDEAISRLR